MQQRYAGNMCLRFEGVDSVKLVENMPMLACSTGSACSAAQAGSSHVLKAVGCDIPALRLGFGRFTTPHDIENACDMLEQAINNIQ
jgi:cysteine desulfurase